MSCGGGCPSHASQRRFASCTARCCRLPGLGGFLLNDLLAHADSTWLYPGVGWVLAAGLIALATVLRMLRWRVPALFWLAGLPLCTSIAHGLGFRAPSGDGTDLLLDASGLLWAVLGVATAMAGLALGQLIGVEEGRTSLARSVTPAIMAGAAALLLGLQGWLSGVGLAGGLWATWFVVIAGVTFIGGLRYDDTARHHAGRVLLGFFCVAGTIVLAVAIDHLVQGLALAQMATVSPIQRAGLEIDAIYTLSNLRKMAFIATLLATMTAGASTGGSLGPASDLRGSMSGLICMGGLAIFAVVESILMLRLQSS